MKTMLRYELKKVFIRRSSRIALILLAVLVVGSGCLAVMGIDYINEDGEKENGTAAIHKLRDAKQEWAGELTEEVIRRVIEENHAIDASVDKETADVRELDMAYSKKQGFLDIRQLITYAFCGFQEYDYYKIDSLSPESAKEFEGRRLAQLKEWLGSDGADQLTDKEKSFLTEKYEEFRFPIRYSPADGWRQLIEHAPMVTMFTVLILGFLTSGIFSSEFRCKTNDIFFSSCYGRDRAIKAKIAAGFLMITGIYWIAVLVYTGIVLGICGTGGADSVIQMTQWKSFYSLTYLQEYVLIAIGGYVGSLFILFLAMLVSAGSKSAVLSVIIPFAVIFLPPFLRDTAIPHMEKIMGLFPDQLLQMRQAVNYFDLYEIGGRTVGSAELLPVLYTFLFLLLLPFIYWIYKKQN